MSFSSRLVRARTIALCALAAAAAGLAIIATAPSGSAASAATPTDASKYYGVWNYDQPDAVTLNNVDVLACADGTGQCDLQLPLPLRVPQVGWVEFSPGPDGTVNGHTDQGCTWNFSVHPTGLELSSTTQECYNPAIGSTGNLTKWSVQVNGNRETESIVAVSHQPNGVDIIGTMNSGSRTKVVGSPDDAKFVQRFLGDYHYTAGDFHTLTNIVTTDQGTAYPEQGTIRFTAKYQDRGMITAHTADGCDWTLYVRGDTAELDPAVQTCHTAGGDHSLHYWGLVTDDGQHINAIRAGSTTAPGQPATNTYLYVGLLAK